MNCISCHAPIPAAARFCPSCGEPVTSRGDERRVATVVFADLVGFTTLGENMDPENIKYLVDGYFEQLAAVIESFGGRVDKFVGDAVVALFGAPVAHEDDAERAVRAALEMQSVMRAQSGEASVKMRVGVNTGQVLVGALRAGGDYTAMGDAINVASRLESAAGPGEIFVGRETYLVTRGAISYEEVGRLEVKGRSEPVETWRAVEALALPGSKSHNHRAPMVGREVERGLLQQMLRASVSRSRAYMAMIVGEAGVGKTRLAHEVAEFARTEYGAQVLEGRCLPYGEANVWWPIASALRSVFRIDDGDSAADAVERCKVAISEAFAQPGNSVAERDPERIAAGLLHMMGCDSQLDPASGHEEAASSAQTLIAGLARSAPVVLILGELHWADDEILEFVNALLEAVKDLPVFMMALARTELEDRWTPKLGGKNLLAVTLEPLDEEAAGLLLESLIGVDVSTDVRTLLLDRSGGNPFFIEELVSLLLETDVIPADARDALAGDAEEQLAEMPATLRGLVAARLDALGSDERNAIDNAAVIGRSGPFSFLEDALKASDTGQSGEAINSLVQKGLLARREAEFEFKSALTREVAYETLTKSERARRHAMVAANLEEYVRTAGREGEFLEQLANHFGTAALLASEIGGAAGVDAQIRKKAAFWIERAADRSLLRERSAEAERLYDQLTGLLDPDDAMAQRRALLGRGQARAWLHRLDSARADLQEVISSANADGDEFAAASALTKLGGVERLADNFDEAKEMLERAVGVWGELANPAGEAEALRAWAMADLFEGNLEPVAAKLTRALGIYRDLGDLRGEGLTLQHLAWAAFRAGDSSEAENWVSRSLDVFNQMDIDGSEAWALGLLAWLRFSQGDWQEAGDVATDLISRLRAEHGPPWAIGMIETLISQVSRAAGRTTDSMNEAQHARVTFEAIGDRWGKLQSLLPLSLALVQLGRVPEYIEVIEEARVIAGQMPDPSLAIQAALVTASTRLQLGDAGVALEELEGAKSSGELPFEFGGGELRTNEVLALLMLGEVDRALALGEESIEPLRQTTCFASFAAIMSLCYSTAGLPALGKELALEAISPAGWLRDRIHGKIAWGIAEAQTGNSEGATTAFNMALAITDSSESRLDHAKVRLAHAFALRRLGSPEAGALIQDARSRLDAMGAVWTGWDTTFEAAVAGRADRDD